MRPLVPTGGTLSLVPMSLLTTIPQRFSPTIPHPLGRSDRSKHTVRPLPDQGWKSWIKGEFDKHPDRLRFLITGSARLDIYRRGGDSLQGRYHHYRLHPLTYGEVESSGEPQAPVPGEELPIPSRARRDTVVSLLEYGGFAEPFLAQSERTLRRWQRERLDRFFREDVERDHGF